MSASKVRELYLCGMENLVALPSSIGMLKSLVVLNVNGCSKLKSLPEEIGDLENLEKLYAAHTLISRPPSSIVRLNKLKYLHFGDKYLPLKGNDGLHSLNKRFEKRKKPGLCFVFPQVNDGLRSLEELDLSCCNLRDGELPDDIGSLSSLIKLYLGGNNFEHLPRSIAQLGALQFLDLRDCERLKEFPQVNDGLRSLEVLDLSCCNLRDEGLPEDIGSLSSLEELNLSETNFEHLPRSIAQLGALRSLRLSDCKRLKEFPIVNVESLEFLNLRHCSSLEKFPEIRGRMKPEFKFEMKDSGIRELPSSFFQSGTHLTKLDLSFMKQHLVALPSSIGMLKSLVELDVSFFSSLEILPEEIGDLENLENLDASYTLISRPPSSISRLNKLKSLRISEVGVEDGGYFWFPQVNEGLRSLVYLDLSFCNLIDGGLPEDIGSLSSLEQLNLSGNKFEHLPRSIAQLGALRSLNLSHCKRLKELSEIPQQLDTIYAYWSNDWICNSLFQNISSLQHISASDSLSLRVFTSRADNIPSWLCPQGMHLHESTANFFKNLYVPNIPSWFRHQGMDTSVSANLLEKWYVPNNFLGFAVCCVGILDEITAQLIPLCDDGMSRMTQKLALSNHSESDIHFSIQFFLVPLSSLWDTSKANGKTPNDYGHIRLSFSRKMKFGLRLLYKDEPSEASDKEQI